MLGRPGPVAQHRAVTEALEDRVHYAMYRRDVPGFLLDAVGITAQIRSADWVLDLGCGTGQVAAVLLSRVGAVLATDPEPDMLKGLRARLAAEHIGNVLPVLASDGDLPAISQLLGARFGAVTVANDEIPGGGMLLH